LLAHQDHCVGMAANMINQPVAIIVAMLGPLPMIMINPKITKHAGAYATEEGCLSLTGERPTTRYHQITVQYLDEHFQPHTQSFSDFFAQIIQHECDHLKGILI
jgi:peptide deformylase